MAITKLNNKAVANVTSIPVALGDMVFISSATASSSASIEFTLGNYKEYKFFFVNMHPSVDGAEFQFNLSTDSGSNYNVVKTSSAFNVQHGENDVDAEINYDANADLAQSTADQPISGSPRIGNGNDESASGTLTLFNPSSTTYVKHFVSSFNCVFLLDRSINAFVGGYANTTSPITNIRFKMLSGNIDAGKILMFGIN
jgi:hypothetical protein